MSSEHESSYYEIALTNRQVLTIFVVLLTCLVAAFLSGVWIGRRDGAEGPLGTDPLNADTDGDSHNDGVEIDAGTDPLDPNDPNPNVDTDADGLVDSLKISSLTSIFIQSIIDGITRGVCYEEKNSSGR